MGEGSHESSIGTTLTSGTFSALETVIDEEKGRLLLISSFSSILLHDPAHTRVTCKTVQFVTKKLGVKEEQISKLELNLDEREAMIRLVELMEGRIFPIRLRDRCILFIKKRFAKRASYVLVNTLDREQMWET